MQPVIVQERFGGAGWREMIALRTQVLRAPLGLAYSDGQLAGECDQIHLALRLGGNLAGTLLLLPDAPAAVVLRQMAIAPAFAARGLGRQLVRHGETVAREALGARIATLSARRTAIGFYQKLGYRAEGPTYIDVTLPHRRMRRSLDP